MFVLGCLVLSCDVVLDCLVFDSLLGCLVLSCHGSIGLPYVVVSVIGLLIVLYLALSSSYILPCLVVVFSFDLGLSCGCLVVVLTCGCLDLWLSYLVLSCNWLLLSSDCLVLSSYCRVL